MLKHWVAAQAVLTTRFGRDERGATAAEYCLMAFLVAVVCASAVSVLGASVPPMLQPVADTLTGA